MKQCVFALLLGAVISAQSADTIESHVAAAQALNATNPTALISLCTPEQASRATPRRAAADSRAPGRRQPARTPRPDRRWAREPMKVFDNLYYVGEREYSSWAVDDVGGHHHHRSDLRLFRRRAGRRRDRRSWGSIPAQIKYVVVSHAHRDHAGGAWYLQERFGARVLLTAADWDMLERNKQNWPKPKRDMVVADRPAADARRYDADVHPHVRSHARDDVDDRAGQGQRHAARCRAVGRNRVQFHDHARAAGVSLVRRLHRVGAAIQRGGGESGRRRVSLESSELGRLQREDGAPRQARGRRAASRMWLARKTCRTISRSRSTARRRES